LKPSRPQRIWARLRGVSKIHASPSAPAPAVDLTGEVVLSLVKRDAIKPTPVLIEVGKVGVADSPAGTGGQKKPLPARRPSLASEPQTAGAQRVFNRGRAQGRRRHGWTAGAAHL
jgi:hypothetical protein